MCRNCYISCQHLTINDIENEYIFLFSQKQDYFFKYFNSILFKYSFHAKCDVDNSLLTKFEKTKYMLYIGSKRINESTWFIEAFINMLRVRLCYSNIFL